MKVRTMIELVFAGETPESVRRDLDRHDLMKEEMGKTQEGARRWIDRRDDLLAELRTMTE